MDSSLKLLLTRAERLIQANSTIIFASLALLSLALAHLMSDFSYIAVAGNIASGKTTLVKKLSESQGLTPFYEANALNPYLTDFYENMNQWAFHSQTFFLIQKFKIHQRIEKSEKMGLLDRTLYEDAEIFAKQLFMTGKMSRRDYNLYREFYLALKQALKPPKLMIYLKTPLEMLQERIKLRGRPEEQNIPLEYLAGLQGLYEEWIDSYKDSELKIIEPTVAASDFVNLEPTCSTALNESFISS